MLVLVKYLMKLLGLFNVIMVIITQIMHLLQSVQQKITDSEEGVKTKVWPTGVLLSLGIIALCCMIGEGAMSDWSTNYMKNIIQSPVSYTTFGLTAFAGAMTIGRLFGDQGRLKYGDFKILSTGAICALFGMLAILSSIHFVLVNYQSTIQSLV